MPIFEKRATFCGVGGIVAALHMKCGRFRVQTRMPVATRMDTEWMLTLAMSAPLDRSGADPAYMSSFSPCALTFAPAVLDNFSGPGVVFLEEKGVYAPDIFLCAGLLCSVGCVS